MPLEDFIIWVFCIVDDSVCELTKGTSLRQRGFVPALLDSEVITMEIVGEFQGIDTDKGIWLYFCRHWKSWFPQLGSRANFAKQAANLWAVKQEIQGRLSQMLGAMQDPVHLVDGFPIPVCLFKRANYSRCFKGEANYGYCASKDEKYYGFHGHIVIDFNGIISGFTVTLANSDEREAFWEMASPIKGLLLGDKGYISQSFKEDLMNEEGIQLETPFRKNMNDNRDPSFVSTLMSLRRLVETVIGQLVERFNIEKVWARDLWHLTNRLTRKILAHTVCVFLNRQLGRKPLQLDGLVEAQ